MRHGTIPPQSPGAGSRGREQSCLVDALRWLAGLLRHGAQMTGRHSSLSVGEQYMRAEKAIDEIALDHDWDREGSARVGYDARGRAKRLLAILQREGFMPVPVLAATPDAGVQLSWGIPIRGRRLEIEAQCYDKSDHLLIGYADEPGYLVDDEFGDEYEVASRIRDQLKSAAA